MPSSHQKLQARFRSTPATSSEPAPDRALADKVRSAEEYEALLHKISSESESDGLLSVARVPARKAVTARLDPPLAAPLRKRLAVMKLRSLWSHQIEAIEALRNHRNTIIATGTASGKSLAFNLPVMENVLADPKSRALYLYPTKALAQDQLRALRGFALPQIRSATYDGDTPTDERTSVRKFANIVLSNPDMLHFGILPRHAQWAELFANLAYVVVDEAHVLRGVFGSHVGCILRRLKRIARHYGASPTFVMASATIANPRALAERLLGEPFVEVTDDGAPRGEKVVAFWNPPLVDEKEGVRGSSNWEAARLMSAFVDEDIRTIAFARSRKSAELVARYAKDLVKDDDNAPFIRPYRAGYLASERREIEQELFTGKLKGVSATTALELGIDVGGLDAIVLNGFPGTVSAFRQQAGRSGRAAEDSVAVLIGQDDPLDQYYLSHPDILLSKPFETALVDTTNPNILRPHLGCAAFELPIGADEIEETFGEGAAPVAQAMLDDGDLGVRKARGTRADRLHWKKQQPPGTNLDIRSLGSGSFSIVEEQTGVLLGTVDSARAFHQVHPGAIYLHQGDNYEVSALDLGSRVALVVPSKADHFTQAREISDIKVIEVLKEKPVGDAMFYLGRVIVTEQVVAFVRRSIATGETIEIVDLDLPPQTLVTVAFWYTAGPSIIALAGISEKDLPGSLHAAEHAGIGILPAFAMADRWDIGGVSTALSADTGLPTVFIYDGYPGGVGIAERGFEKATEHLTATLEAVRFCQCESGCPSCVQSPKCGNGNDPLDKRGAIALMAAILN